MSFGKTSKSNQTTQPADPAVRAAYNDLISRASSLSEQPLQQYHGNLVAPLNATQNAAISGISGAVNYATPYLQQAQDYATRAATPIQMMQFSPEALQQYMSPYTQDVVDATQNQFNLQNGQQQTALRGSAAASGALGGDREAVLQSQLAGQQQTAQAPVISGLYNQGFNTALGEFNTQQGVDFQRQLADASNNQQTAYSLANLGLSGQNALMQGYQAQLGAGGLQQQVSQEQLDVPYEQYLQRMAYPYQNLDFLSSILGGAAQGTGSTTTGSRTQPVSLFRSGGHVRHPMGMRLAVGGVPQIPDVSMGYVPASSPMGGGGLHSPGMSDAGGGGGGGGGQGGGLLGSLGGLGKSLDSIGNSSTLSGIGDWLGDTAAPAIGSGIMDALAFIGLKDGGRSHLADGGDPDFAYINDGAIDLDGDPDSAPAAVAPPSPAGATILSAADTPPDWRGMATNFGPNAITSANLLPPSQGGMAAAAPTAVPTAVMANAASAPSAAGVDPSAAPVVPASPNPSWDDGTPVNGMAGADTPAKDFKPEEPSVLHSIVAGLGSMLAHHSIGAGILGGLEDYDKQEDYDRHPTVDHSGQTVRIFYPGEKKWIDTGIPSEAALNAKAMNDWRMANTNANVTTREDAIRERATAAAASTAERAEAAREAAANRANAIDVARINAGAGRYTPVPGQGLDPTTGKLVPGAYVINGKTGDMDFRPGVVMTGRQPLPRPPAPSRPVTPTAALANAQRDYDRIYPKPQRDPSDPGAPMAPRPSPPEGMMNWLQKRAAAYQQGQVPGQGAPPPVAAGAPGPALARPTPATAARVVPPSLPHGVPSGSQFSPSRRMWRDSQGHLYTEAGQPVQ